MFTTSLASGPATEADTVAIEIPKGEEPASDFLGAIRVDAGDGALVGLSGGDVLVVARKGPLRTTPRVRTWTRGEAESPPLVEVDRAAGGLESGVRQFTV
jgi:hypothetical protein